jgi:hypothetical protein
MGSGVRPCDESLAAKSLSHILAYECVHPQVEMEKHWLQYDEEEDVISIAVADAILDDLLFDITSELVLL